MNKDSDTQEGIFACGGRLIKDTPRTFVVSVLLPLGFVVLFLGFEHLVQLLGGGNGQPVVVSIILGMLIVLLLPALGILGASMSCTALINGEDRWNWVPWLMSNGPRCLGWGLLTTIGFGVFIVLIQVLSSPPLFISFLIGGFELPFWLLLVTVVITVLIAGVAFVAGLILTIWSLIAFVTIPAGLLVRRQSLGDVLSEEFTRIRDRLSSYWAWALLQLMLMVAVGGLVDYGSLAYLSVAIYLVMYWLYQACFVAEATGYEH